MSLTTDRHSITNVKIDLSKALNIITTFFFHFRSYCRGIAWAGKMSAMTLKAKKDNLQFRMKSILLTERRIA